MTYSDRIQIGNTGPRVSAANAVKLGRAGLLFASALSAVALWELYQVPLDLARLGAALVATGVAGYGWLRRDGVRVYRQEVIGISVLGTGLLLAGSLSAHATALLPLMVAISALAVQPTFRDRDSRESWQCIAACGVRA